MEWLSWRQTDFGGVVLAGLIAGYVMAMAGLWAARVPGFVSVDIADFGRRYIVSDRPSAWVIGFISHEINSILLTLVWATVILPNVAEGLGPRLLSSILWGLVLAVFLAGSLVAPMTGLGFLGRKTGSARFAVTNIGLHIIWGTIVGIVYSPP